MKKLFTLTIAAFAGFAFQAESQTATRYNSLSGVVWIDADSNNVRDAAEPRMPGVLVTLVNVKGANPALDSIVASALTNDTGGFMLRNFYGTGTFYVNYVFPSAGYDPINMRAGTDNAVNSAADPLNLGDIDNYTVSTPQFTVSSNGNLNTFGLGLHRIPTTLTYWSVKDMSATTWANTFRLPKSKNSIALASQANILVNEAVLHPTIGFENTGAGPDIATVEASGRLSVTLPANSIPQLSTSVVKDVSFLGYDGTTDFGGTSGYAWDSSYGATHNFVSITSNTQLTNAYRTTAPADSFSITSNAVSFSGASGSANLVFNVSTLAGSGVFVTYVYPTVVALPIKLVSFDAQRAGSTAVLRWEASSTTAGERFVIERSADGGSFTEIGSLAADKVVKGLTGTYRFTDEVPAQGINYYRLKLVSSDTPPEYSHVTALSFGNTATSAAAFPNPATGTLSVPAEAGTPITLLNAMGQTVLSAQANESGISSLNVSHLPSGSYILRIGGGEAGLPLTQRILIQHP